MTTTTPQERSVPAPFEVAIIGSGPAGLVSAKTLLVDHFVAKIVIFEETSSAGGLWNRESLHDGGGGGSLIPTGKSGSGHAAHPLRLDVPCVIRKDDPTLATGSSNYGTLSLQVPSSPQPVYDDLRINLPKDMTSFLGHPFPSTTEHFPGADQVDAYYKGYCRRYGIDKVTRYHTRVVSCRKGNLKNDSGDGNDDKNDPSLWTIETVHTLTGVRHTFRSRRLLVCNGHFRKAFAPYLPGLEHFKGKMLHSSAFRSAADMQGKTVLIVGGSISGSDISDKILTGTKGGVEAILSVREWKISQYMLLPNLKKRGLIVRPGIDRIDKEGRVHFVRHNKDDKDYGTREGLRPDVIIFATGYRYHFPFLKAEEGIPHIVRDDGYKMEALYKRILSVDDPTLAFIGITNINFTPAVVLEYQARWFAQVVVKDRCKSLNKEAMVRDIESRRSDKTQDALALKFPSYCNSLARDVGVPGYWMQLVSYRLLLFLRTMWAHFVIWITSSTSAFKANRSPSPIRN